MVMKKLLLIVFVAIMSMGLGFAQPGGGDPAARLQRELDGLTTELGLTKDQVAKVTPIVTEGQKAQSDAFAKMREGGGDIDRTKMMEVRTKIMGETDKKLKAVLSPEQGVKLDAFRKKQAEERAKRMQNR
jgi:Spy/CpxP family protein refolding chaperone